jgi:hypothetical protein
MKESLDLDQRDREEFIVLLLDAKRRVIGVDTVSIDSLTASIVHSREVFKPAIAGNSGQSSWRTTSERRSGAEPRGRRTDQTLADYPGSKRAGFASPQRSLLRA